MVNFIHHSIYTPALCISHIYSPHPLEGWEGFTLRLCEYIYLTGWYITYIRTHNNATDIIRYLHTNNYCAYINMLTGFVLKLLLMIIFTPLKPTHNMCCWLHSICVIIVIVTVSPSLTLPIIIYIILPYRAVYRL